MKRLSPERKVTALFGETLPQYNCILDKLDFESEGVHGRCADVLVKCLEREKIEYIFGIPGEENLDVLDALKSSSIKLILCRHEQAAGFMAATVGRLTGKPGMCISTLGPGATNFSTAAAYAHLGGMPMFILTGQKPIRKSKQGHFQIVDIVDHFRSLTKFTKQVVDPVLIPSLVRQAYRVSIDEKPGPVHLELPEDIAALDIPFGEMIFPRHPIRRPIAEDKAVQRAVELVQISKRPLICIGAASNRKVTQKMLRSFIRDTGMYAVCTQMGKGVIPEDSPQFLGCTALSANDLVHVAVENADLILNVGHDIVEKPPFFMKLGSLPVVIHINFNAAHVDSVYFPQHEVLGDVGNAIWQIKEKLDISKCNWDQRVFEKVFLAQQEIVYNSKFSESEAFPLPIQRAVKDIRQAMPDDGIICLDNGMYKIWFARQYKALHPNTVLLDNALATMGAGVPSAMGAKITAGDNISVLAICGDGGFMMNSQELETAVRLNLHIVIVVLNDSAFGMIKWKQGTCGFNDFGLDVGNPDFKKYAESYGAKGYNVESSKGFAEVLQSTLTAGKGVHLINVPISYATSDEALNVLLPQQVEALRKEVAHIREVMPTIVEPKADTKANEPQCEWKYVRADREEWKMILGGEFVSGEEATMALKDKDSGNGIAKVHMASVKTIEKAIAICQKGAVEMAALTSFQREAILRHCVSSFEAKFEEFAQVLCTEAGKPIKDAKGEVQRLIDTFKIASEECIRGLAGEYQSMDISARNQGLTQLTRRFPIGPVAMISPFNFPLNLAAHKIAPAIAAGCPFVLKPASATPLGALMIGEVLMNCSLMPKSGFSILPCQRSAADLLTTSDAFKLLSFTGSPQVGWEMKARAGKKKVVLELGGNAACIVDTIPKEGLQHLVDRIVFGAYYQSGQSCISTQRLLVRQDLYHEVVTAVAERVSSLIVGPPSSPDTFIGPMISAGEASRLFSWLEEAVDAGARVMGGQLLPPSGKLKNVLHPTFLTNVSKSCLIWQEEAFGPALCAEPFTKFEDALKEVNAAKFGIHAGIFTDNMDHAFQAFNVLEVGGVVINDVPSIRVDSMPYGGVKESGIGREGVRYAMEDMTEIKAMLIKNMGVEALK